MQTVTNKTKFYLEDNNSDKLIIFSHGFGVRWDSRGMFTEIAGNLKDFDFIFFDYTTVDENGNTYVESIQDQIEKLRSVLDYVEQQNYSEINIVAHSFGAVGPLKINPGFINKLILIAPPTSIDKEHHLSMLRARPDSKIDLNGYSEITRSDGSKTFINYTFYNSLNNLDFFELLNKNSAKEKFIIIAMEDELLDNDYPEGSLDHSIKKIDVHGDHNFKGEYRKGLIEEVKRILNSKF